MPKKFRNLRLVSFIYGNGGCKKRKRVPGCLFEGGREDGSNPGNCFVFEDILPAVLGAKKGGFQTVLVREPKWNYAKEDFDLICDYAVDEIDEAISLLNQWKCDMIYIVFVF